MDKTLKDQFVKEYFRNLKESGYELNGAMYIQMEKDLYIAWLEEKVKGLK